MYLAFWIPHWCSFYSLDNTQSRLQVLYAKQGRSKTFKSKADRDKFLNDEIKSLKVHEKAQEARVDQLNTDVGAGKRHLGEVTARAASAAEDEEERRENLRKMGEEVAGLKKQSEELQEERK